jgi:hypothetical protein
VEWIDGAPTLPEGEVAHFRAFEAERSAGDTRLRVAILDDDPSSPVHKKLLRAIEEEDGIVVTVPDRAEYTIVRSDGAGSSRLRLASTDGTELPVEAHVETEGEIDLFVMRLAALARAHRILRVGNESSPRLRIEVTPLKWEEGSKKPRSLGPDDRDRDGVVNIKEGEIVSFRVRNRSEIPVYTSLVVISPDGEVSVPWSTPDGEPIPPGDDVPTPRMRLQIPKGADAFYVAGADRFRFVVTPEPHNLHSIEQSPVTRIERHRGTTLADPSADGVFSGREAVKREDWLTLTMEFRTEKSKKP